jgi:hypothetical protein
MKFFNTSGPVNPEKHYCLPLSTRLNENELRELIAQEKYFILHAPRQTGKTSTMLNFAKTLNAEGKFTALYVNIEGAQAARGKYRDGLLIILRQLKSAIERTFGPENIALDYFKKETTIQSMTGNDLFDFLQFWAQNNNKPLIIFFDEIDALIGDTLISVLRQLRTGYTNRPKFFPQSVCLIGVRDVRDYRIWSDEQQAMILGGSAFNIKAKSLRLKDFNKQEVHELYLQHTQATGQNFDDDAVDYAFEITQGQPWLVNALAYEACFEMCTDRTQPITKDIIEQAKEILIKRRDTHLDVLIDRLREPRVRNVIEPILLGQTLPTDIPSDDLSYCIDLGILSIRDKNIVISNPIYQEVLPRELIATTQQTITQKTIWYLNSDGTLDMPKLLEAFTQFFREHSDAWLEKFDYKEAGPHLLLMAFLQRIINGGGKIHREYALGRKRMDLLVEWLGLHPSTSSGRASLAVPVVAPQEQSQGDGGQKQRIVIELKLLYGPKTLIDGLKQTTKYMDTCKATEGHLVIFDRTKNKTWEEKIYTKQETVGNKIITVWGM